MATALTQMESKGLNAVPFGLGCDSEGLQASRQINNSGPGRNHGNHDCDPAMLSEAGCAAKCIAGSELAP